MPEKYRNLTSVKVYKRDEAFDPEYRTHILSSGVDLKGFSPAWIGQEVIVACNDSTTDATIQAGSGVTFDGSNNLLTFNDANDHVLLLAISMTRWLIVVNNGVAASSV